MTNIILLFLANPLDKQGTTLMYVTYPLFVGDMLIEALVAQSGMSCFKDQGGCEMLGTEVGSF